MKFKRVMRYDDRVRMFRICRFLVRERPEIGGPTAKLSLAVWPKVFRFSKEWREWDLTVLGVRLHWQSGGGIHV